MPTNTTYDPQHIREFQKGYLNKSAKGFSFTATAGQSTSHDYTLTDDMLITGGSLLVSGGVWGDTVDFQVVHPIAGVLAEYVSDWYINPASVLQKTPSVDYPAKLPAGLILRVIYNSVGETNVNVAINYDMELVLS